MNKYKLLIIICFFLVTICLPRVTATVKSMNLLGKVIILDAGHGVLMKVPQWYHQIIANI